MPSYPSVFAGWFNAASFAFGCPNGPGALVCQQSNPIPASPAVAQSMIVAFGYTTTNDGRVFYPLALLTPIRVGSDSNSESVTPLSVTGNGLTGYQQVSFTADFADAHGSGDPISSATFGLQEALNYAGLAGGGKVVIDEEWVRLGGTTGIKNAAVLPSGVTIVDNR